VIAPLVDERKWILSFRDTPEWQPSKKRILVIAPHPDDETLGAGGLIADQRRRGVPVSVIAVTDGDAAYADVKGLAGIRRIEQEQALQVLGVRRDATTRLSIPDSKVAEYETELESRLAALIGVDDLVVAPWDFDSHPDHEACGRAARKVAKATGAALALYMFWTWHHKATDSLAGEPLRRFELDEKLQALKWTALNCHRSQLEHDTGEPILPEKLLGPAKRPFEIFIIG
jgi:LmbE family N-acetylglucosaminyl deacetylase